MQAPPGTQLDVPIPKAVSSASLGILIASSVLDAVSFRWDNGCIFLQVPNCPAKYQIYLKSIRGPIDVVLLNKRTVSSALVVLPVPPSEEILQSAKSAISASENKENNDGLWEASAFIAKSTKSEWGAEQDMQQLQESSFINSSPNKTEESACEYLMYSFTLKLFI